MSTLTTQLTPALISAKVAAALVPYTRDYIARIAREGKISAVQIDRQWFVESTSLQNFYEQSLIEDEVRSRHLSHTRKLELEVKEAYQKRFERLHQIRVAAPVKTAVLTAFLVLGSVSSGLLFLSGNTSLYLASVSDAVIGTLRPAAPVVVVQEKTFVDYGDQNDVLETSRRLPLRDGIVLLPTVSDKSSSDVRDLFSDNVTATFSSDITGVIEMNQNGIQTKMPFVRIPDESSAEVVTTPTPHVVSP